MHGAHEDGVDMSPTLFVVRHYHLRLDVGSERVVHVDRTFAQLSGEIRPQRHQVFRLVRGEAHTEALVTRPDDAVVLVYATADFR